MIKKIIFLSLLDLKGKTACFPSHEGAAYFSTMNTLLELKLIEDNCARSIENFFSLRSCFGPINCRESYHGDIGAMKCLEDFGDIAFVNMETFKNISGKYN